ncbi:MAG TPA: TetR family transcriptional regulator C-terminal domain-containing protein [Kribbella sp.]|uniref:TetR/AcrR family transcriptional regulator n=1 Tax=Kribbella sp. TaxID=1871183 RepID=UPI002D76E7E7|nr:TetR family transcriptional regulator C-terminal domain-containing protein [Kribbella sp.]HET6293575.1 TetR family transcriptional regulator C-terminal domain-containing protein [Kribbella sp.]
MTKTVPLGEDRRDAIADAAIHLVATRGLRGLTHRAVDAEAGLPPGSTSYYLRTRKALLDACVRRMLARDLTAQASPDAGLEELLVGMVLDLVHNRTDDLVARYELSLEASRQPELREAIVQGGRQLRDGLTGLLEALGIPDAEEAAWPVAAMLDGLMYDRVAGAGTTMSPSAYESAVRRAVGALLTGLQRRDMRSTAE